MFDEFAKLEVVEKSYVSLVYSACFFIVSATACILYLVFKIAQ